MEHMPLFLHKLDRFVHRHLLLFSALLLLVALRLPNFFEPYWYGDEAIYLTIGTAMRHGERLYADIIDHKTPIIYYLAAVPNQLDFRILNVGMAMITISMFWWFGHKYFRTSVARWVSLFFLLILTTVPWFEGMIPNGELFVMCFVSIGMVLFAHTSVWRSFLAGKLVGASRRQLLREWPLLLGAGIFWSLGVLTKVPGLFDVLAFFFVVWCVFVDAVLARHWKHAASAVGRGVLLASGLVAPIILSIAYYISRGSGQAYLDYGLLYNFHYIDSFVPSFSSAIVAKLFTLPAKAGLTALVLIALTLGGRLFNPRFRFAAAWFGLALFASLLSNRPYPHYYLQVIPPLALVLGYAVDVLAHAWRQLHHSALIRRGPVLRGTLEFLLSGALVASFVAVLLWLHVGLYETVAYYQKFGQLMTHQISANAYRDSFSGLDADNYAAAPILRSAKEQQIFIWGTDPMLYALSGKSPVGRFTVAFHIFDFHAETETLIAVEKAMPPYVVVMNEERSFPELRAFLNTHYIPNYQFTHFVLWKRL